MSLPYLTSCVHTSCFLTFLLQLCVHPFNFHSFIKFLVFLIGFDKILLENILHIKKILCPYILFPYIFTHHSSSMFFHSIFKVSLYFLCFRLIMTTLFKASSCFFKIFCPYIFPQIRIDIETSLNHALPHYQMVVINYSSTIYFQNYEL